MRLTSFRQLLGRAAESECCMPVSDYSKPEEAGDGGRAAKVPAGPSVRFNSAIESRTASNAELPAERLSDTSVARLKRYGRSNEHSSFSAIRVGINSPAAGGSHSSGSKKWTRNAFGSGIDRCAPKLSAKRKNVLRNQKVRYRRIFVFAATAQRCSEGVLDSRIAAA